MTATVIITRDKPTSFIDNNINIPWYSRYLLVCPSSNPRMDLASTI